MAEKNKVQRKYVTESEFAQKGAEPEISAEDMQKDRKKRIRQTIMAIVIVIIGWALVVFGIAIPHSRQQSDAGNDQEFMSRLPEETPVVTV